MDRSLSSLGLTILAALIIAAITTYLMYHSQPGTTEIKTEHAINDKQHIQFFVKDCTLDTTATRNSNTTYHTLILRNLERIGWNEERLYINEYIWEDVSLETYKRMTQTVRENKECLK